MNEVGYGSVMALYLKLPEVTDQHAFNQRRWDELLESGEMGLYETQRVETDRYGHLVLSPWAIARHGIYQSEAVGLLARLQAGGRTITECPVSTSDGVKLVDAAWMSRERFELMREFKVFEMAPEICIEVLSPSNTRAEMEEKRDLYFEIGCLEFWTVGATGKARFFDPQNGEVPASVLCPDFPVQLEV
jgi:Uma2 family endonuclease